MRAVVIATVALLVATACASPVPTGPLGSASVSSPGASASAEPSPLATSAVSSPATSPTTVTAAEWSATCSAVDPATCSAVATVAFGNLGRSLPPGVLTVQARPACPQVPDWADGSRCWQVYLPVGDQTVCMVIAKRTSDGQYAQVAGDVPGKALLPSAPRGCP
jgi:hypothetical protein